MCNFIATTMPASQNSMASMKSEALKSAKSLVANHLSENDDLGQVAAYYEAQLSLTNSDLEGSSEDHDNFVTVERQDKA